MHAATLKADPKPISEMVIRSATRAEWADAILDHRHDPLPHRFSHRPKFATACWRYTRAGLHLVTVGLGIQTTRPKAPNPKKYIGAYVRHELAHAMYTERDLEAVKKKCDAAKIPFGLLNLFEDARIEDLGRIEFGIPFEWLTWEMPGEVKGPIGFASVHKAFFNIIQADGDLRQHGAADEATGAAACEFYERCIKAKDTWAVIVICADFISRFPPPPQSELDQLMAAMSPRAADMLASLIEGKDEEEAMGQGDPDAALNTQILEEYTNGNVLALMEPYAEHRGFDDEPWVARGTAIANVLAKEIKGTTRSSSTMTPTRRLNTRALATDREDVYRRKDQKAAGKIKAGVIIDCSGSMGGMPSNLSRIIVKALSVLAERGMIEGCAVLSIGESGRGYTQTLKLPVSDENIAKIEGCGSAENLEGSFRIATEALRKMDMLFCVTDGMITDRPLDVERLRRQRMNILALYANAGGADPAHLLRWFPQALHRNTIDQIEAEIAIRFRKALSSRGLL